ncbi:hypothetical protein [Maricaulis sp. CAU 1757]
MLLRRIVIGLLAAQLLYVGWWAFLDVTVRFSPMMQELVGPETTRFILQVGWLQEVIFYSGVLLNITSLVLFQKRTLFALVVYAMAVSCYKADWILATLEGHAKLSVNGAVSLVLEALIFFLMMKVLLDDLMRREARVTPD